MLFASIEVVTIHERFSIMKRGCHAPYRDWRAWAACKPVSVVIRIVELKAGKESEVTSDRRGKAV